MHVSIIWYNMAYGIDTWFIIIRILISAFYCSVLLLFKINFLCERIKKLLYFKFQSSFPYNVL